MYMHMELGRMRLAIAWTPRMGHRDEMRGRVARSRDVLATAYQRQRLDDVVEAERRRWHSLACLSGPTRL